MNLHPVLDLHDTIAWDMDKTLIKGDNSAFWRAYIAMTPHKTHHVITFRETDEWADIIIPELHAHGLHEAHRLIAGIHRCPTIVSDCFNVHCGVVDNEINARMALYEAEATGDWEALKIDHAREFIRFKGKKAAELGCTVLVDDLLHLVKPGCDEHGVILVDSLAPITLGAYRV
jgi:hypothetical protein